MRAPLPWRNPRQFFPQQPRQPEPQPHERPGAIGPRPMHETDGRIVDAALYESGRRIMTTHSVAETVQALHEHPHSFAWIGLEKPSEAQVEEVAKAFDLHHLAVEDAVRAHQRPKIERYGPTLFTVLRATSYRDAEEEVDFSELHVFVGRRFVVTLRHSDAPDLAAVRRRMEDESQLLAHGPEAVLYAIFDAVVDGFGPVVRGLEQDIEEIEDQVFAADATVSRRIYELSREVIGFQRATKSIITSLQALASGWEKHGVATELRAYWRDVIDHVTHVNERVDEFRSVLRDILTVNSTLVSERQNEKMELQAELSLVEGERTKRISSWAAIFFAPTLVAGIYGMNFKNMPELDWPYGYPFALSLMVVGMFVLWWIFKRNKWL